jgi:hypothetical protein
MQQRKQLNNLSVDDLLKLVENEKVFKAEETDIPTFVKNHQLRPGNKFYSSQFLYFLYLRDGFKEIYINSFTKALSAFLPKKRKAKIRGFSLRDIKERQIDLYEYNQEKKKKTKRFIIKV